MTPPQWPTTSTSTLANIAHASMVWHGASGHHFSMAWLLQFGFCAQLWLSPGPYCPSASIQSAKETVVYSKLLQNKQGQCGACRKLWSLDESDLYVCVVPLSALLVIPFVRSDFASDVFSISSPTLWNNLPQDVRSCAKQATFKSRLKSHLFSLTFTV